MNRGPAIATDSSQLVPAPACVGAAESKRIPCACCGAPMEPEHAHYRCAACGYIEPCCGW